MICFIKFLLTFKQNIDGHGNKWFFQGILKDPLVPSHKVIYKLMEIFFASGRLNKVFSTLHIRYMLNEAKIFYINLLFNPTLWAD